MPSRNQPGSATDSYQGEPYKILSTKSEATIKAVVNGIDDVDRARAYIEAEVDLANRNDRDVRKRLIAMLNAKVSELKDSDGGDT